MSTGEKQHGRVSIRDTTREDSGRCMAMVAGGSRGREPRTKSVGMIEGALQEQQGWKANPGCNSVFSMLVTVLPAY